MADKEFVDGLIVKFPNEGAPDFVKFAIAIKRKELGNWLRSKGDEWINIDVKTSKAGKLYAEVNNWGKQQTHNEPRSNAGEPQHIGNDLPFDDDLPF